jgi:hypothetical protein
MIARYPDQRIRRRGHTLIEMVVAMAASVVLLAGLGSVMMIARQVAYTPSAATSRMLAADVINQVAEELRYATLVIQQTPQILEFVVDDRDADGTAEKIRYEWSGTAGDPLQKSINGGTPAVVLGSIHNFQATLQLVSTTRSITTTAETAPAILASDTNVVDDVDVDVTTTYYCAQVINPTLFSPVPTNALSWNATSIEFYGDDDDDPGETLLVQLRAAGDPNGSPTSSVLGQVSIASTAIDDGWTSAVFASPIRGLALHRLYAVVWASVGGDALRMPFSNSAGPVFESTNSGASWNQATNRRLFYRVYGTYTVPGSTYTVTRQQVRQIDVTLQASAQSHARVDGSIPLANLPELLTSYWRTDFSSDPTTINANGDAVADWAVAGGGTFDTTKLINGIWFATGALETRPLNDFTTTTTIEARCRNTTVGGNGAVIHINADRQAGLYAPLLVYVQRQADGTQSLSLHGKTSDSTTKQLFARQKLSSDFVRFRITVLPQYDVVNLAINDEDQGTFTYPIYTAASTTDRYLTMYADTSLAEFDYVEVRGAAP